MADVTKLTAEEREFRDDAALAALSGMLNSKALAHLRPEEQARIAYQYGDAMVVARKGGSNGEG